MPPLRRRCLGSAGLTVALLGSGLPFATLDVGRRNAVLSGAAAGLVSSRSAHAESIGTKCWTVEVPKGWEVVSPKVDSLPKRKLQTILELQNTQTGAQAKLLREPLGSISKTSMADGSQIQGLTDAFVGSRKMTAMQVVEILTKGFSDPFKPAFLKWLEVKPPTSEGLMDIQDDAGRRYVRYEYETLDCSGAVKDGTSLQEICRGKILPRRRHITVATVGFEEFTPDMPGKAGPGVGRPVLPALWKLEGTYFAGKAPDEVDALLRSFRVIPSATPQVGMSEISVD